jgi:hypothetical protein
MDGRDVEVTNAAIATRNRVVSLLEQWGMVTVVDRDSATMPMATMRGLVVVKSNDRDSWRLSSTYDIGHRECLVC